ncbi:hypothetical protein ACVINW_003920 [Bradyrhizobium sp. USDA 4461]
MQEFGAIAADDAPACRILAVKEAIESNAAESSDVFVACSG